MCVCVCMCIAFYVYCILYIQNATYSHSVLITRWVILKLPFLQGVGWCFGEDGVKSELRSTSHSGHSGKRTQWARNGSGHGAEGKWPNMRMISETC